MKDTYDSSPTTIKSTFTKSWIITWWKIQIKQNIIYLNLWGGPLWGGPLDHRARGAALAFSTVTLKNINFSKTKSEYIFYIIRIFKLKFRIFHIKTGWKQELKNKYSKQKNLELEILLSIAFDIQNEKILHTFHLKVPSHSFHKQHHLHLCHRQTPFLKKDKSIW